jgi:hypothetical protein
MLHFQKLDVYQRAIENELYERGVELLERIVTMLRSSSTPDRRTASITFTMSFPFPSAATLTGAATARATITATINPRLTPCSCSCSSSLAVRSSKSA